MPAERTFRLTERQEEANALLAGPQRETMLFGGSRSGKTFLLVRAVLLRALKAPASRHAIMRYRHNHLIASVWHDTLPKVRSLCWPDLNWREDKTHWFIRLPNDSEIWFGGLDEQARVEKILGQEHATIYLNESSQIPWSSRNMAITRLAQSVEQRVRIGKAAAQSEPLPLRMYYDCNPPADNHWSCRLFVHRRDPITNQPLKDPEQYRHLQMNPQHNAENLPPSYVATLESLPERMRKRFLLGEFQPATPNALWTLEQIERYRVMDGVLPDMQRMVVAVDPSGAGDDDQTEHDDVGIAVVGLGVDGVAYVLEDLTCQLGPSGWSRIAVNAYERHSADVIVGEVNYGGAMVEHTIRAAGKRVAYRSVTATRGKVVRAEPISVLYEQGKVRHVGQFTALEDELCAFTTSGYVGNGSPNRADAVVWALTELFPGLTREKREPKPKRPRTRHARNTGWMAA